LRSPGRFTATAARLVDLVRRRGSSADPSLVDRIIKAYIDAEAYRLYTFQTVTRMMEGERIGAESSLNKIFWSELDVRMHEAALELLGEDAELVAGAP